jgi:hypothetical protein
MCGFRTSHVTAGRPRGGKRVDAAASPQATGLVKPGACRSFGQESEPPSARAPD